MLLQDYDMSICCLVDLRYGRNHQRIKDLFEPKIRSLEFLINGKGNSLLQYSFTTQEPPVGWRFGTACYQHFYALQMAVRTAKERGVERLLWIEDDCVLTPNFDSILKRAAMAKAPEWDLFYYGGNHSNASIHEYSHHLMRVSGTLTSHMVGVRNTVFDRILSYTPTDMIDKLFADDLQKECEAQAVWPCVALQEPGFSTLWGVPVDYNSLMETRFGRRL